MGLFNTFGAFVPKTYNVNPEIVRPATSEPFKAEFERSRHKKTNEYYLKKDKKLPFISNFKKAWFFKKIGSFSFFCICGYYFQIYYLRKDEKSMKKESFLDNNADLW